MSTRLLLQEGVPRVGRYPLSVVNDAVDSRSIIDEQKAGRPQPVLWQPCIKTLAPIWKPQANSQLGGYHSGACIGDLAYFEGGLSVFNGRIFKDLGLNRQTLVERFVQLPKLAATGGNAGIFTISYAYSVPAVDFRIWTAPRPCIVRSIRSTVTVIGTGGACTVMPEKVPSGIAIGAGGTQKNLLQAGLDLVGVANTSQVGTLSATPADLTFAAGDSLAFNWTGTATSATGDIMVEFEDIGGATNDNFEILGTNCVDSCVTANSTGGIILTTTAASADQVILTPKQMAGQSAWKSTLWSTAKRVLFEALVSTDTLITTMTFWAGVKLTNAAPWKGAATTPSADNDQLVVWFDSAYSPYLVATLSINNVDTTFLLTGPGSSADKITVAANTAYHIEVGVDSNRYAYVIVNGILYVYHDILAMASITSLIPSVGVQSLTGARILNVRALGMSQDY